MKKVALTIVIITLLVKTEARAQIETCTITDTINERHIKAVKLNQKLKELVALGVPGAVIAIKDGNGCWAGAAGFAKTETQTPMQIHHLQFGQSVAKTYMATAILLLFEDGKIDLDEKISAYLPESVISNIANTNEATVRMLLNHTSGIAEYNDKPDYVNYLLQHPLHTYTVNDYLDFVRGALPNFSPGEKFSYCNTNYILLALIADKITGDHKKFIQEEILSAHGLNNSFYNNDGFMEKPELVNTYWDQKGDGKIENCSEMHRTNVGSLIGDDGIIATPMDYIAFLEKLLTNQILKKSTMDEMLDVVQNKPETHYGYKLGIHRNQYKEHEEIGHTGGGIGAACVLGYFTDSDTYYFIGINLGTSLVPRAAEPLLKILDEIYDLLLE